MTLNDTIIDNIKAIRDARYSLQRMDNPSEDVHLHAVKQNGRFIRFIKNPSEAVQLAAINNTPWATAFIEQPTIRVQECVIQKSCQYITEIQNPDPSIIKLALTNQRLIDNSYTYDFAVNKLFKDNAILMKKWLRYGEAMRDQQ
jgi:hypothetical protein